jgi:predicted dehydrogenase
MGSIGIGIVGAGFAADLHAHAYRELSGLGIELVGVASRTEGRAEAFAERHRIGRVFADTARLLACREVDVVDLCVPNYVHHELVLQAARAGKHIICEKPLTGYFGADRERMAGRTPRAEMFAAALESADEMVGAARERGVKLMYAENWVYAPAIQKVKRLIEVSGGTILELRGEESHHGSHAPSSMRWRTAGGGALIRLGAHPIGAILHLKRCEGMWRDGRPITVRSVSSQVADLTQIESVAQSEESWIVRGWEDVENWATAILTFSDGSKGIVSASDVCLGGMKDTLDVYLSNARVHCDLTRSSTLQAYAPDPGVFKDEYLVEKLETKAGWSFPSIDENWFLGYQHELRDFIEAVRDDREPLSDGQLGRDVVQVIYGAYLSAERGQVVDLGEEGTR